MLVPIIYASEGDREFVDKIVASLERLNIPTALHLASAHKVPEKVFAVVQSYNGSDEPVCYITVAGRSNGLSGVVAANSVHPVIACPPHASKEEYMIDIHSSLRMPSDTPVLIVIDPGNAALAAARILALTDKGLQKKIASAIKEMKKKFA